MNLSSLVSASVIPTGAVLHFASTSSPSGWIQCDGATITNSGATANLYNFLQTASWPFGAGKVPDLRGKFIRSNGSDGTYSSGTFGAIQADLLKNHKHSGTTGGESANHTHSYVSGQVPSDGGHYANLPAGGSHHVSRGLINRTTGTVSVGHVHGVTTGDPDSSLGGVETRPVNIALLACIKL